MLRTRWKIWGVATVALITAFLWITSGVEAQKEEIAVGMAISLSGKYDVLGTRNLQGARMWADWVNEQGGIFVKERGKKLPVKLIWYDDKSDRDTVVKLTEKLIVEDKVDFIIGPYGSGLNLAAIAVTERHGKMMLIHSGASDKIWEQGYKYAIGVLTPSSGYYRSALKMLKTLEPKVSTVALITEDEPFNRAIQAALMKLLPKEGFRIIVNEVYPEKVADLSPILTKVKALNPDAILTSSHFRDGALLAKQAAELGVLPKFFALGSAPSTIEWWETVGPKGANATVATSQWEPVDFPKPEKHPNWYGPKVTGKGFNEWFKKKWGVETDFRGVQALASGLVLQWGIERAGSLTVEKVRQALNDMDIMTFYGRSKIDPRTAIQEGHEMVVAQWQNGKSVVVWPPEFAEAKLIYPMPPR
jgi:branched-chain amino acid transport system substrate-binding protein